MVILDKNSVIVCMGRCLTLFFLFSIIFISCSPNSSLDQTLKLAGDNRTELEKVLIHYCLTVRYIAFSPFCRFRDILYVFIISYVLLKAKYFSKIYLKVYTKTHSSPTYIENVEVGVFCLI